MQSVSSFQQFDRLSGIVGGEAALRLTAFFGGAGNAFYIPTKTTPGHFIEKLIGRRAFAVLVDKLPGETIHVSQLRLGALKNAGKVYSLSRKNISDTQISSLLAITPQRVNQIRRMLEAEGFGDTLVNHDGIVVDVDDDLEAAYERS